MVVGVLCRKWQKMIVGKWAEVKRGPTKMRIEMWWDSFHSAHLACKHSHYSVAITCTGPIRPEGKSGESLWNGFHVVLVLRFSGGRAWSPIRRFGQRLATVISSSLPFSRSSPAGSSTSQGSHQTTPRSRPLSFTEAMSWTVPSDKRQLLLCFRFRGKVKTLAIDGLAGVVADAFLGPLRPVVQLLEDDLFGTAPGWIEGDFPGAGEVGQRIEVFPSGRGGKGVAASVLRKTMNAL